MFFLVDGRFKKTSVREGLRWGLPIREWEGNPTIAGCVRKKGPKTERFRIGPGPSGGRPREGNGMILFLGIFTEFLTGSVE